MDPVWAAILGGAVGGVIVAFVESFLSRSRDHQRWLREQRQQRYGDVIRTAEATYRLHNEVLASVRPMDLVTGELRDKIKRRLAADEPQIEAANVQLQLIASPRMVEKGSELASWSNELWWLFEGSENEPVEAKLVRERTLYWELIEEFIQAARADLGAGRDYAGSVRMWYRRQRYRWGRRSRRSSTPPRPPSESGDSSRAAR